MHRALIKTHMNVMNTHTPKHAHMHTKYKHIAKYKTKCKKS